MTVSVMRIGWIRHGITEWNTLGKIQGTTDIPLSPEGVRQARRLADRLAGDEVYWQGVVSSDLQRAAQTAKIVAHRLEIPVLQDERLRERSFGEAEGTTLEERLRRWGENWRKMVPDQESDERILSRGRAFVADLESRHPGQSWLVVTHGSFLARMLHAMCPGLDDSHLQNASLTVVERNGDGWVPRLHNCTVHLNEEMGESRNSL